MKRAILYTFSGTGNTLLAAGWIADGLKSAGLEVTVAEVRVPLSEIPAPDYYDIVGFGYPVHAFNAPEFFKNFVKSLPEANSENKPAFFFKTSGEPFSLNGASSKKIHGYLKKKGYDVLMETHLLMPYNIMFRYNDSLAKQMYITTESMCARFASRLVSGERDVIRYRAVAVVTSVLLRLQWFGAWINGPMIHANKSKCTGCSRCAQRCPAGNIKMVDGKPKFGWKCTMCMRCAMDCPADAVRPGFLNPWRVNGPYPFEKLVSDESVPADFVNENTKGYFGLFRKYYRKNG